MPGAHVFSVYFTPRPSMTASVTHIEYLGQPAVQLRLPDGSEAVVLCHGAHVVSWHAAGWGEQLYLSPLASAAPGKAVRGGVPVIFPQFEQRGPDTSLPRHGFARTVAWAVDHQQSDATSAMCCMKLADDEHTRQIWPHAFELELTVALSPHRLDLELHVNNPGQQPWTFAAALHTYVRVTSLASVRLQGLDGCHYLDAITSSHHQEDHAELRFHGAMDRIYAGNGQPLLLRDGPRLLTVANDGFDDVVLWNPGEKACANMADMPDADWQHMLCVEGAQIGQAPVLEPGASWTARQSLVLPEPT